MSWKDDVGFKTYKANDIYDHEIIEGSICFANRTYIDKSYHPDNQSEVENAAKEQSIKSLEDIIFNKHKMSHEFWCLKVEIMNEYYLDSFVNKYGYAAADEIVEMIDKCKKIVEKCLDVKL